MKNKAQRLPVHDLTRDIVQLQNKAALAEKKPNGSALTTFTTTWAAATTPPSIGNGTIVSTYRRDGSMCWANISLTWGSTTTGGTGFWTFTVPFQLNSVVSYWASPAIAKDASDGWYTGCVQYWDPSTNTVIAVFGSAVSGADVTHPFTWATGDQLILTMYYPTAG
jgi:hypothetical protein